MAWKLEGTYFETCSCEVVCPCTASLALGADYDRCRVTLVFHVDDGEVEGTDVSGLTVAAVADTPKVMTDGNWRLGVFIDDGGLRRAGREARRRVRRAARRPDGGARAARSARTSASSARRSRCARTGLRHSVRIGDAVDFEIEDVVPFGVESGEPARLTGIFHPAGSELTIAQATRSSINAFGIEYEGKAGVLHARASPGPPDVSAAGAAAPTVAGAAASRRRSPPRARGSG